MKKEFEDEPTNRIRRVGNSKEPTPKRMSAIASNLRTRLNTHISISIQIDAYDHVHVSEPKMKYSVWIASRSRHEYLETWSALMELYHKIMKEGLDSAS